MINNRPYSAIHSNSNKSYGNIRKGLSILEPTLPKQKKENIDLLENNLIKNIEKNEKKNYKIPNLTNFQRKPSLSSFIKHKKPEKTLVSSYYEGIYYTKSTFRKTLKRIPIQDIKNYFVLSSLDEKSEILTKIAQKVFNEIPISIDNLLICQKIDDLFFSIFFSDCKWIPYSNCCNMPVYLTLGKRNYGDILCSEKTCSQKKIAQFYFLNNNEKEFDQNYIKKINDEDNNIRKVVNNLIITGKFKNYNIRKHLDIRKKFNENENYNKNNENYEKKDNIINKDNENLDKKNFNNNNNICFSARGENNFEFDSILKEKLKINFSNNDPLKKMENILSQISKKKNFN